MTRRAITTDRRSSGSGTRWRSTRDEAPSARGSRHLAAVEGVFVAVVALLPRLQNSVSAAEAVGIRGVDGSVAVVVGSVGARDLGSFVAAPRTGAMADAELIR